MFRRAIRAAFVMVTTVVISGLLWAPDASPSSTAPSNGYRYVSPIPGSRLVSAGNTIAIRPGGAIDPSSVATLPFRVVGSRSGPHDGTWVLSDDARTLIFTPSRPYAAGENVSVTLEGRPRTRDGRGLPPLDFTFTVAPEAAAPPTSPVSLPIVSGGTASALRRAAGGDPVPESGDLPAGFPPIIILSSDHPDPGCLFVTPLTAMIHAPLVIVDNLGMPIYYHRQDTNTNLLDFKVRGDVLTYFDQNDHTAFVMDSTYAVVDSFKADNGYYADFHDMQLLPNGHALLLLYDTQPVGMDTVVAGGDPDAYVTGLVIQEQDASKNVVFQWRSWDHFQITDAVDVDLTAHVIDYVHGNSIDEDDDGNLLLSSRHLNEITKIDHDTGNIIWRLGLNAVNNQFTFVNDPRGFSHQHDARCGPNGDLTVFDNGNYLNPEESRAIEYQIDEQNKVATLVWEYRPDQGGFSHSSGSVQRLEYGSRLIGWGNGSVIPDVTDLHADGSKALEITFYPPAMTSYRAYRFPWRGALIETDRDSIDFGNSGVGQDTAARGLTITNRGPVDLDITSFVSSDSAFSIEDAVPLTVPAGGAVEVLAHFHPQAAGSLSARMYVRSAGENDLVAQVVDVSGYAFKPGAALPVADRALLVVLALVLLWVGTAAVVRRRRNAG